MKVPIVSYTKYSQIHCISIFIFHFVEIKAYFVYHRQVPVKKKKTVHLENSKLQEADGSTVPYSPSPCDSGFHDSKLVSSRSSNLSSSLNQPNYMNDINLRTKFCNEPNLSKHGQHLKQESHKYNICIAM